MKVEGFVTVPPSDSVRSDARRNRALVLAAASQAFAVNGLAVSLAEIAQLAGVGAGTVYRHFPSKDSLMEAVLAQRLESLTQSALRHLAGSDASGLFPYVREIVDSAMTRGDLCQAFESGGWPSAVFAAAGRRFDETLERLLTRAQAAGEVRADVDIAALRAVITGCVAIMRAHPEQKRVVDLMIDSLRIRNETRDEISERACRMCEAPLPRQKVGRPAAYCSASCRQTAFRRRRS